jgi:D-alanyl-D-alanine carboxypeptidase/Transglycosylase SLT domain
MDPTLQAAFNSMQAAAAKEGITIGIGSGDRTTEEQIALRRSNCGTSAYDIWQKPASQCSPPTAIPGHSNHNKGLAIDFTGDEAADAWVAQNASKFGLHLPVQGENWHLELIDGGSAASGQTSDPLGIDMEAPNPEDELASRVHSILRIAGMGDTEDISGDPANLMGTNMVQGGQTPEQALNPENITIPIAGSEAGAGGPNPQSMGKFTGEVANAYQGFAKNKMQSYGWSEQEMAALIPLWQHESGWNPNAQNPTSTAYGIAQFLNGTWGGTGYEKTADPYKQVLAGLEYIKGRYGSPSKAWEFWQKNNWY